MGYKLWSSNELLTSTDLNTYLSKQSVIVCTSGTRPSSPPEGMLIYETDFDRYRSWNGTEWSVIGQSLTLTFTPTLTATTTNPTLGTGSGQAARYTLFGGKFCHFRGTVLFGTSGNNQGSGQYLIALPFTAVNQISGGVSTVGAGAIRCAGSNSPATFYIAAGSTTMAGMTTSGAALASGAPGAWGTSGDYLSFSMTYETA